MYTEPQLQLRDNRVRILLSTRLDYLPTPSGVDLGAAPGPVAGKRVPCGVCRGKKRERSGRLCRRCDASGLVRRKAGEPGYDEYISQHVGGEEARRPRVMTSAELDESIARLEAMAATREGRIDHERYGWERTRERRDSSGAYVDLERSLEGLRRVKGGCYTRILDMMYGGWDALHVDWNVKLIEARAVRWLSLDMPKVIRVPRWAYEDEVRELRTRARNLKAGGLHPDEIAASLGVNARRVRALLEVSK